MKPEQNISPEAKETLEALIRGVTKRVGGTQYDSGKDIIDEDGLKILNRFVRSL